jgi:aldehyde:ferredoxin oxidoreductase
VGVSKRLVNTNNGVTRKDDVLPKRIFEPTREGPHTYRVPKSLEQSLDNYYRIRGWNKDGIPQKERTTQLNISDILEE